MKTEGENQGKTRPNLRALWCGLLLLGGCQVSGELFARDGAMSADGSPGGAQDAEIVDGWALDVADGRSTPPPPTTRTFGTPWDGTISRDRVCTPDGFCGVYPRSTALSPRSVWVGSDTDIWVGGVLGLLMHWNGDAWHGVASTGGVILRLHGCSSEEVWALQNGSPSTSLGDGPFVPRQHRFLRWNGVRWHAVAPPLGMNPMDVRCVDGTVWILGAAGRAYRWESRRWVGDGTSPGGVFGRIADLTEGRVLFAGQPVSLIWNGTHYETRAATERVQDVVTFGDEVFGLTAEGTFRWGPSGWVLDGPGASHLVAGEALVAQSCHGPEAFAREDGSWRSRQARCPDAGQDGTVQGLAALDGGGFLGIKNARPLQHELSTVFGDLPDARTPTGIPVPLDRLVDGEHFYEVSGGVVTERSLDGGSEDITVLPFGFVAHAERNNLWAVDGAQTARFDGTEWVKYDADDQEGVFLTLSVSGETVWAVGQGVRQGALYRWTTEGGWARVAESGGRAVLVGADYAWALMEGGAIHRWNGDGLAPLAVPRGFQVVRLLEAEGDGRLWALLSNGNHFLGHWDGQRWSLRGLPEELTPYQVFLPDLIAIEGDQVWAGPYRWDQDEWVRFRVAEEWEPRRLRIAHGYVWYEGSGGLVTRRPLAL